MAKSKSNKKRKRQRGKPAPTNGAVFGADLVRETLGNFLGNLLADGLQNAAGRYAGIAGAAARASLPPPPPPDDVAARLLRTLAEHGPKSIAELMELSGCALSPLLQALQTAQQFRLIELVEEGAVVQLTAGGNQTVTVIRKDEMSVEAPRLLES